MWILIPSPKQESKRMKCACKYNPFPLILNTPNLLKTNTPYKRAYVLGLYLLLGGWGCLLEQKHLDLNLHLVIHAFQILEVPRNGLLQFFTQTPWNILLNIPW